MQVLIGITVLMVLTLQCQAIALPGLVKKCKYGDGQCIVEMANAFLPFVTKPIPEFGLPVGDPMAYKNVTITSRGSSDGPVNIRAWFKTGLVYGLAKVKILSASGFEKDPRTSKFAMTSMFPLASMVGDYEMKGKFMFFQLNGGGFGNLTCQMVSLNITLDTMVKTIDGEDYLYVKKVIARSQSPINNFQLNGMFANKEINDNLNAVLNENHEIVFEELRPSLSKGYAKTITPYLRKLFMAMPYRMFFDES